MVAEAYNPSMWELRQENFVLGRAGLLKTTLFKERNKYVTKIKRPNEIREQTEKRLRILLKVSQETQISLGPKK